MNEIAEEFEEWKPLLLALVELRQLREENEILKNQVRALTSLIREQNSIYAQH